MEQAELKQYALVGLRSRLDSLDKERAEVMALIESIEGTKSWASSTPTGRRKRTMSDAGKEAIAKAQRERWARQRRIEDVKPVAEPTPTPTRKATRKAKTTRKVKTTKPDAKLPKMPRLVKAKKESSVPF